MKKKKIQLLLMLILVLPLTSQSSGDNRLTAAQRSFARGNISTKIQELRYAVQDTETYHTPLFLQAASYLSSNILFLGRDRLIGEMIEVIIGPILEHNIVDASPHLWVIFENYPDISTQQEILSVLGSIAVGSPEIIAEINDWVTSMNNNFQAGMGSNTPLMREALITLGRLGNPASFLCLFQTANLPYPQETREEARRSLLLLRGNFIDPITGILQSGTIAERHQAMLFTLNQSSIPPASKRLIAEIGLNFCFQYIPETIEEQAAIQNMRLLGVNILSENLDPSFTHLVIEHFDLTLEEQALGTLDREYLIKSINFLGSMASHEAAERLTLYLDVLSIRKENNLPVDEQVVYTVILNLGDLGDSVAFDNLFFANHLSSYSEWIRQAAREAMERLF